MTTLVRCYFPVVQVAARAAASEEADLVFVVTEDGAAEVR